MTRDDHNDDGRELAAGRPGRAARAAGAGPGGLCLVVPGARPGRGPWPGDPGFQVIRA